MEKRKPRDKKTDVDITKPLKLELADDSSCYGKMYNPQAKECANCHDSVTCGIHYQKFLKEAIRQREKDENLFLDMQDFNLVPVDLLIKVLNKQGETPVINVVNVVAKYANSKDRIACMRYLVEFAETNGFIFKDGKLCTK